MYKELSKNYIVLESQLRSDLYMFPHDLLKFRLLENHMQIARGLMQNFGFSMPTERQTTLPTALILNWVENSDV